jgi:hypothetical protein
MTKWVAAMNKLAVMVAFLGAVWLVAAILSFSLVVPNPSGYGVAAPSEQGDEADEL